ncbi:hypothetical protein EJ110_NYTH14308 [Nymphaea thermarum]|nr:hypothetical protein EJ110_NYTH14308 [Nymphaea thermarum]
MLCSPRSLSPCREESGDEELSVLPRHTKVIVTGNNRTKSVLVGLQGVVKKAVGLGGWHWLVLKNGVEVKLQRNALSVIEAPTGNEDDDDECDNSFSSSSDIGSSIEFHKPVKPRVRHPKPWVSSAKSTSRSHYREVQSGVHKPSTKVNLAKLETAALWRYWRHFNLVSFAFAFQTNTTRFVGLFLSHSIAELQWQVDINPNPSKEQLIHAVQRHFTSQQLDEFQVIVGFIQSAKRLKTACTCNTREPQ